MRFLLIFVIVVLIAGCSGNKSSMINLDDTTLNTQLMAEFEKQMAMTWEPDIAPIIRWDEETRVLYWCLRGDYDLSGEVNLSDITPIARYFEEPFDFVVNPSLVEGAPWWVDGDENGEITIADITPIVRNFGQVAIWWKTSVGWGQPLGGYGGLFYVHVPEAIDPLDVGIEISDLPPLEMSPQPFLNSAPGFAEYSPSSLSYDESISITRGSQITFSVRIYDVDDDFHSLLWFLYEEVDSTLANPVVLSTVPISEDNSYHINHEFNSTGKYWVFCRVADMHMNFASISWPVVVN